MRPERPPSGSGNGRLALGVLAMAPALAATYAHATLRRRQFATPRATRQALAALGLDALRDRSFTTTRLGTGKSNAVALVTFDDGHRIVLKRALPFGTMMAWGARHFGANFIYAEDTTAAARIAREAGALRTLAAQGVAVPRVLAASPRHELLAIEFIDGAPAATALYGPRGLELAHEVGALLGRVHALGVTLADGHPGNMLLERGTDRLVLFDLEFAELDRGTPVRRGFDIAYASVLLPSTAHVDAMLAGYGSRSADDREAARMSEQHLRRYAKLLEMERERWAPASPR